MFNLNRYYFHIAIIAVFAFGFYIISYSRVVVEELSYYISQEEIRLNFDQVFTRREPIVAKGLYLTAYSAANPKKRAQIIDLITSTELNAVVIDIKDYSGYILYNSSIPLVNDLNTKRSTIENLPDVIKEFHDHGIYVIARQTVFQDPVLAEAKSEWAIRTGGGGIWHDYKGLSWVDPTNREIWDYNVAIAQEAIRMGFDEINFDYVRFPSDGNISRAVYADLIESKEETMRLFYEYLETKLKKMNAFISLDLFGMVLEAHNFDLNIGQRLALALDTVDYVYPMTYPSHYPDGHLGLANPAEHPYRVIQNGLTKAESLVQGQRTLLRPWLQAFDLGAVYDGTKIRAEIDATEESAITAGWMLWNASNRYTSAGLKASDGEP